MRYVRIDALKEGMINGKPIFGQNSELLLREGVVLREPYIRRLKEMGYQGIYIKDLFSDGITVIDIIDPALRIECVKTIKDAYLCVSKEKIIHSNIVQKLKTLLDKIIDSVTSNDELLMNIIDLKNYDDYTYSHSVNVTILSLSVGYVMGLSKNMLFCLGMAALLHDIGKVFIPRDILNKSSKLNEKELEIVRTHSFKGYQILKDNNSFSYYSSIGVLHHHEKYNGTGYPSELSGSKISLLGRIIAISDVYDALTSDRPYRKALFPSEAMEYIMGGGGTLFDSEVAKYFVRVVVPYPAGTSVLLSNGAIGIVFKNYPDCCLRPMLKIIKHGDTFVTPYYLDLRNDPGTMDIVISGIADL